MQVWKTIKGQLKKSKLVWEVYDILFFLFNGAKGLYWETVLKIAGPQKQANALIKRQNVPFESHVDLQNPTSFFDKMQWLKYNIYNNSTTVARCYNKYTVREYLEQKGCEQYLNELYGVWNSIDEIPWEKLPEEYVMKVSNGYSNHFFKRANDQLDKSVAIKTLKKSMRFTKFAFRINGDMFAYKTQQKIICEKLLRSKDGYKVPDDYKFYCFHGEPKYIEVMWDRYGSSGKYNEIFVDMELKDRHDLEKEAREAEYNWPVCMDEMIAAARILSADFPFVRVDFYEENGHPVFGELTFTPYHAQTRESMTELGALIDMRRMGEYRKSLVDFN